MQRNSYQLSAGPAGNSTPRLAVGWALCLGFIAGVLTIIRVLIAGTFVWQDAVGAPLVVLISFAVMRWHYLNRTGYGSRQGAALGEGFLAEEKEAAPTRRS